MIERPQAAEIVDEGFSQNEAGLPTYHHHDPDSIETDYAEIEGIEGEVRLRKGAMAAFISNNRVYGEKSLESFAGKMNLAYPTLREYANAYERVERLENDAQASVLSAIRAGKLTTTHIRVAAPIESDRKFGAVLARAHDGPPQRLWPKNEQGQPIPVSGLTVSETASAAKRVLKQQKRANHRALGTGENEWYTPPDVLEDVRSFLGGIELDPASSEIAQDYVQAERFLSQEDNALTQQWECKTAFLNPPYAQPAIELFAEKMVDEYRMGRVGEAVMLTHNYTDTRWFHIAESEASAICFTRGRIKFVSPEGELASPTQGQAFFYYGDRPDEFREAFAGRGFVR